MSKAFKWSLGILFLIASSIVVMAIWPKPQSISSLPDEVADREIITLTMGYAYTPRVEVVTTPASITQGLSGRKEIGSDGMLFVLPERRVASFWMRDMLFDLDMVWIDGSVVVKVDQNVPAPSLETPLEQLPTYSSEVPVTHVLELPAGKAREMGVTVGSIIGHHAMME